MFQEIYEFKPSSLFSVDVSTIWALPKPARNKSLDPFYHSPLGNPEQGCPALDVTSVVLPILSRSEHKPLRYLSLPFFLDNIPVVFGGIIVFNPWFVFGFVKVRGKLSIIFYYFSCT